MMIIHREIKNGNSVGNSLCKIRNSYVEFELYFSTLYINDPYHGYSYLEIPRERLV